MTFTSEIHESLAVPEEVPRTGKRDIKNLLESLKEMEEEKERLKQVESRFLTTRDVELLKPFAPDKRDISRMTLKEPITEPHYLCNIPELREEAKTDADKQLCDQLMQRLREDVKLFNPDAEIRTVEKTDGSKSLAVVGVDFKEFAAFVRLRYEERKVERDMARTQRDLVEAIANQPTKESHSYIPAIVPVSPTIAANRKVMHH